MRVLVTGGAGYIGSHVVLELCQAGYEVTVFDDLSRGSRENVDLKARFVEGTTLNEENLQAVLEPPPEAVVHLAAFKAAGESMREPEKYARNNLNGTVNLLNAMLQKGINTLVFSSSAAVYGQPLYLPLDEKHPLNPVNYYGYTKLEIERNLDWFARLRGLKYAALRYFNAAGYDLEGRIRGLEKNPANLLPVVMEAACGIRSQVEVFGNDYNTHDGTGVRDYIHVTDLARAHRKALEYLRDHDCLTVNLATGEGYSVLEVINTAREVTGAPIPHTIGKRRAGDPAKLVAISNKARETLDWQARHSDLETILKTMWQVYRTYARPHPVTPQD